MENFFEKRHKNLNASLFVGRTELGDTFGQYHL